MTKKWSTAAMPPYEKLPIVIALSLGIWLASCGTGRSPRFITVPKSQLKAADHMTDPARIANLDYKKCPVKQIDGEPIVYTGGHAVHDRFIKRGQEYPMPPLGDSWLGLRAGKHSIVSKYEWSEYDPAQHHSVTYASKDYLRLEFEAIAAHQYFVACVADPGTMTWSLSIYDCTDEGASSHDDWLKRSKRVATTESGAE